MSGRSNEETSLYPGCVVDVEAPTVTAFVDAVDGVFPHVIFLVDCLYCTPTAT